MAQWIGNGATAATNMAPKETTAQAGFELTSSTVATELMRARNASSVAASVAPVVTTSLGATMPLAAAKYLAISKYLALSFSGCWYFWRVLQCR